MNKDLCIIMPAENMDGDSSAPTSGKTISTSGAYPAISSPALHRVPSAKDISKPLMENNLLENICTVPSLYGPQKMECEG